jgi:nucleotide-binding universal stress UspA family protein
MAHDLLEQAGEYHERYLAVLAKGLKVGGLEVATDVLMGDAADEILCVLDHRDTLMVVMATHGRSGLGRWRYGSVASRIARETPVPAMMIGPRALEGRAPASPIRRILVPLDGSSLAELALQPARELAEALPAGLVLVQVLRWASPTLAFGIPEIDTVQVDRDLEAAARDYLQRASERLSTRRQVSRRVLHGAAADMLLELIEAEHIDLVVMASHTRGGLARAVLGSVADRLIQGEAPVLLVRPGTAATQTDYHLAPAGVRNPRRGVGTPHSSKKDVSAARTSHG